MSDCVWSRFSRMLGLLIGAVVLLHGTFLLVPGSYSVFAQEEVKTEESFKTDAVTTYTVLPAGSTKVEHRFTITNLKPTTYLKQYVIKLQFPTVTEITATDQGKSSSPEVKREGTATSITLNFDDQVVGEGKTRVFTIAYITKDISVGSGNVLELRIPALAGGKESQHQVFVNVPIRFGNPVRTSPEPNKKSIKNDVIQLQYNQFPSNGISALFGDEQTYLLTTRYRIKNPSSSLGYTHIALPPDTSFQRVEYESLEPRPKAMKVDEDGNWIATYNVPAATSLDVNLATRIKVTLMPDPLVPIVQPTEEHLAAKEYWQSDTSAITDFAQPATMRDIYDKVIKTLTYDDQRVTAGDITSRLGAQEALQNPSSAVCQEYADVLIAGWRSAGIPSRRLNGYAYSQNQDVRPLSFRGTVLHAWVDYFDQSGQLWRMVDPTWEDTTGGVDYFSEFDLNHIVLSINGVSSSDPAPAGSYTESPEEAQLDVKVIAASASARPAFTLSLKPVTAFGITVPGSYTATIKNETGRAWYDTKTTFQASPDVSIKNNQPTNTFLPFEEKSISLDLTSPLEAGWKKTNLTVTLLPSGETTPYEITQENLTATPEIIKTIASVNPSTPLGVIAILSFLSAGSILVFGRKRKTTLRWQSQKSQKTTKQLSPVEAPVEPNPPNGPDSSTGPVA